MRVFVAGGSGAIGRPLVPQLVAAGHQVTAMTRREERAPAIRAAGAEAVVCDVFDRAALEEAVGAAAPQVVINELTGLPEKYNNRKASFYEATDRLRSEGAANLLAATRAVGAERFVTQSVAFLYAPEGDLIQNEDGRPFTETPGHFRKSIELLLAHEQEVTGADDFEGVVLRYGQFYGPGTYYAPSGSLGQEAVKRRFPIVGEGTGVFSFIHVDDAAGATVAAVEKGGGLYNVVDDEPSPLHEWLPVYAEALGAKPPRRAPVWLAKLVAGKAVAGQALYMRGASNAKAKRELGWQPRYPSWRQGFRAALG